VLNLQGGTIIGDAPPYEAFSLGGGSSVRGYDDGAVGSGRSFIQTTGEYRFPAFALIVRKQHVNVRGIVFVDYATTFGTGNEVLGKPSVVREKPGDGLGYGIGLQALTPFGLLRLESGWNERGGNRVYVDVGDRF
jgi:outer membrane protein insertion porin family